MSAGLDTARAAVWYLVLAGFVLIGSQGLRARRADYEYIRVPQTLYASDDQYLSRDSLSSELLNRSLADVPVSEPLLFVRRHDAHMFEEFSILSYTVWPRILAAVGCGENGQPEYVDFAPRTDTVSLALVDSAQVVVGSENDTVQHVAPTIWLIRASPPRTWSSFCR